MCSALQDCQCQLQDETRRNVATNGMQARQGTSCEIDGVAQSAAVASIPSARCNIHAIHVHISQHMSLVKLSIQAPMGSLRHGQGSFRVQGLSSTRYRYFVLPHTGRYRAMVPEAPRMWRTIDIATD